MRNTYPIDMPIPHDAHPLPKCPCGAIGMHKIDNNTILCDSCMQTWVKEARAKAAASKSPKRPPPFTRSSSGPSGGDPDDDDDMNFCRCGHPSSSHARMSARRYCKLAGCGCSRYDPRGHI